MPQLPLEQAIPRFKANEERVDNFTNGSDTTNWLTSTGVAVPSLRKFLRDKSAEIQVVIDSTATEIETITTNADNAIDTAVADANATVDQFIADGQADINAAVALADSVGQFSISDMATLQARNAAIPVNTIIHVRSEGFTFQVVNSSPDRTTVGGTMLRAILRGDATDVPAMNINRTGTANVTAKLQDYFTRRAGKPSYIPDGIYRTDGQVTAPAEGLDVTCGPGAIFNAGSAPAGTFTIVCDGVIGAYSALTAGSADKGSKRIRSGAAFATSLAVGDRLKIRSNDIYDPGRTDSMHGEIVTVTGLADAATGYIDLAEGLAATYTTNPVAAKLTLRKMKWSGGEFLGAVAEQNNQTAIRTRLCDTPVVEKAIFRRFDSRALWIEDCPQPRVRKSEFHDTRPNSTGYGVSLIDAAQDGIIEDNLFRDCRHATSTNNQTGAGGIPRRHTIQNNLVIGGAQARGGSMAWGNSIDTHAAAEDIWIKYNTVRGCPGEAAINLECSSGKAVGNLVEDSAQYGILAINQSGVIGKVAILDNEVRGGGATDRAAIRVAPGGTNGNSYFQRSSIRGNEVLDRVAGNDYHIGNSSLPALPNVTFSANYSQGGVGIAADFFNCRSPSISGNTLRSPVNVQAVRVRSTPYANINGNVLMTAPSGTATIAICDVSGTSPNANITGNTVTATSASTVAPSILVWSDSTYANVVGNNTRGAGAPAANGTGSIVANNL